MMGQKVDKNTLFGNLYRKALEGDADCGGLMSYGYLSGEPITGFEEGRPLFMRKPDSKLTLANFMRTHLYSSLATLKYGMDIMFKEENVSLDKLMASARKVPAVSTQASKTIYSWIDPCFIGIIIKIQLLPVLFRKQEHIVKAFSLFLIHRANPFIGV